MRRDLRGSWRFADAALYGTREGWPAVQRRTLPGSEKSFRFRVAFVVVQQATLHESRTEQHPRISMSREDLFAFTQQFEGFNPPLEVVKYHRFHEIDDSSVECS